MKLKRKDILLYTLTPQITPRLKHLIGSGFSFIAYFIALVYSAVRLLPAQHPYVQSTNIGHFGIRHVVAEAANNLTFNLKNIDQIILFVTILTGLAIGLIQIMMLIGGLFMQPVLAALPTNFAEFFIAQNPEQDLALMMMDLVFGVPDIFKSCISTAAKCVDLNGVEVEYLTNLTGELTWPFPIHRGLHQMLSLYSIGLTVVGVIIMSYFIVTVVAETAQSGTPFGQRFNKVWAPVRFVVAFGLLMPLGFGLNSAQYITLYAAKFGSGFATNGWVIFNNELSDTYLGAKADLITEPNMPDISSFMQFMYTMHACKALEEQDENLPRDIKAYLVKSPSHSPAAEEFLLPDINQIINFADGADRVTIRFGEYKPAEYAAYKGHVAPICGEITLAVPVKETSPYTGEHGALLAHAVTISTTLVNPTGFLGHDPRELVEDSTKTPKDGFAKDAHQFFTTNIVQVYLSLALAQAAADGQYDIDTNLLDKGWGGGGIWYNKIAEKNGAVTSAILGIPRITRYPAVMETVYLNKKRFNETVDMGTRFDPSIPLAGERAYNFNFKNPEIPSAPEKASIMYQAFSYWNDVSSSTHTAPTGNVIVDVINMLFGTEGLFNMRKNKDKHPLAQITGIGKSLVDSAINNIGYALVGAGPVTFVATLIDNSLGTATKVASSFVISIAMIALSIGFLLYYIIPFLPFMYFFFAMSGWVKGIFEAMVGVPLWALAHIRIDGQGLPGDAAKSGYFLILEIFLRPILIVFGLIASISIFGATVTVLNDIWDQVTSNLAGFDARVEVEGKIDGKTVESLSSFMRNGIDEFFYTVVYAIIVYIMGISSFKLIDEIPNNITRWLGENVQAFNDNRGDATDGLMSTAYIGTNSITEKLEGGLQQTADISQKAAQKAGGKK